MGNTFEGVYDVTEAKELQKCAYCGSQYVIVILSIDDVIKGLRVEKLYPACAKCCKKFGVELPDIPEKFTVQRVSKR